MHPQPRLTPPAPTTRPAAWSAEAEARLRRALRLAHGDDAVADLLRRVAAEMGTGQDWQC